MRLVQELTRYVGASTVAFLLDVALLWLQVSILGWPYLPAAAVSFLCGTLFVYVASVRHIFAFRRLESARNEFTIFLLVGLVGLSINLCVIYLLVDRIGLHYLLAKVGAAATTFLANFGLRRWFLFTQRSSAQ
jgi:putative flippase GtrA